MRAESLAEAARVERRLNRSLNVVQMVESKYTPSHSHPSLGLYGPATRVNECIALWNRYKLISQSVHTHKL